MKEKGFVVDLLAFVLGFLIIMGFSGRAFAHKSEGVDSAAGARIHENYGKLPLSFIQNDGQVNKKVKFYEKGRGHNTFFTSEGVYLQLISRQPEPEKKVKPELRNSKLLKS